jgi:hypothetical protein
MNVSFIPGQFPVDLITGDVDPVHSLAVHRPAFTLQQNVQPSVAPAAPILSQLAKSHTQTFVRFRETGSSRPVS